MIGDASCCRAFRRPNGAPSPQEFASKVGALGPCPIRWLRVDRLAAQEAGRQGVVATVCATTAATEDPSLTSRRRYLLGSGFVVAIALAGCSSSTASPPRSTSTSSSPSTKPSTAQAPSASASVLTAELGRAFHNAGNPQGLAVTQVTVYTPTTDPNHLMGRQGEYTSKTAWVDPVANQVQSGDPSSDPGGIEHGGGIEAFATVSDAEARLSYLQGFRPPFGDGYDYLLGTAILRLSYDLTPSQAATYKTAFHTATATS